MTGVELLLAASLAASAASGVVSYQASSKQQKLAEEQRKQEQIDLQIQNRLDRGDTLAQVSGLGVSSKSASIAKFLTAQRSQLPRDLQRSRNIGEIESDLFKYNKQKAIFDTTAAITSTGYTYQTRTKPAKPAAKTPIK